MTIYDIARELNVSPTTVSTALKGDPRVAAKTRERVTAYAAKIGFAPNENAKNFRLRKSFLAAVVVYRIDSGFWSGVIRTVEQRLGERYSLVVCNSEGDLDKERRIVETLKERRIEGLIIQPASKAGFPHLAALAKDGIPTVLFEKTDEPGLSFVKGDDYAAAREAVRLFASRGRKRVAMLTFKTQVVGNYERLAGFEAEAKALGIDGLCRAFEVGDEASERIGEAFLPSARGFDAVLCSDDMLVLPLLKGLREQGLKCPDDLAVLSWNDSPFLNCLEPSVSSFAIPVNGMGEKAADAILSYQAGERKLMRELLPEAISYRASFPKEGKEA